MPDHECLQTKRIELLEGDLRAQRKVMNGKFDDLKNDVNQGFAYIRNDFAKVWSKIDEVSVRSVTNKVEVKWLVIIALQLIGLAVFYFRP